MTQILYLYADVIYKNDFSYEMLSSHTTTQNFAIIELAYTCLRKYLFEPYLINLATACCYYVCLFMLFSFFSLFIGNYVETNHTPKKHKETHMDVRPGC